ncbi:hypothetical protein ACH5RR_007003 [Cinchona calisaya]|uniref:Reverse transcriptase Ty1/copia-type domain-containing protein n=1 Tax=Cinchona calisaya TaxID=153742 RepID=A0ABD3AQJ3_9GENT
MKEWQQATKEELMAIQENETWELTDLPNGKNVIGLKWIFKTKYHVDGSVLKHKAHLVAKGYSQQQGIDFEETFSPVAGFDTVRILLALATQLKWPIVRPFGRVFTHRQDRVQAWPRTAYTSARQTAWRQGSVRIRLTEVGRFEPLSCKVLQNYAVVCKKSLGSVG